MQKKIVIFFIFTMNHASIISFHTKAEWNAKSKQPIQSCQQIIWSWNNSWNSNIVISVCFCSKNPILFRFISCFLFFVLFAIFTKPFLLMSYLSCFATEYRIYIKWNIHHRFQYWESQFNHKSYDFAWFLNFTLTRMLDMKRTQARHIFEFMFPFMPHFKRKILVNYLYIHWAEEKKMKKKTSQEWMWVVGRNSVTL